MAKHRSLFIDDHFLREIGGSFPLAVHDEPRHLGTILCELCGLISSAVSAETRVLVEESRLLHCLQSEKSMSVSSPLFNPRSRVAQDQTTEPVPESPRSNQECVCEVVVYDFPEVDQVASQEEQLETQHEGGQIVRSNSSDDKRCAEAVYKDILTLYQHINGSCGTSTMTAGTIQSETTSGYDHFVACAMALERKSEA